MQIELLLHEIQRDSNLVNVLSVLSSIIANHEEKRPAISALASGIAIENFILAILHPYFKHLLITALLK